MKPPPLVNHPPRQGGDSWRLKYYKLKPPPHVNHPPPPRPRARLVYKAKQQPRKPRWPDVLIQWTLPWIG